MFTSYIKGLNDMVFSTTESPEDQPSTGVLGRIGSWFSPWRGRVSSSQSENDSVVGDCAEETEREESEHSAGVQAGEERQWDTDSNSLVFFPCDEEEEEDATQSAHTDGSLVSSSDTREKEEEFGVCQGDETGQGLAWEEKGNGALGSGIPEKNVSPLTDLRASSKQETAWDFDQAPAQTHTPTQEQAQAGQQLHVEESIVTCCAPNQSEAQEVVTTALKENLPALPLLPDLSVSTHPATVGNNVTCAPEAQICPEDSQFEPQVKKQQAEEGGMGRKNTSRRRARRKSQGDEGSKSPGKQELPPSLDKSSTPHTQQAEADSSPVHNPHAEATPGGGESHIPRPEALKLSDDLKNLTSVAAATPACQVDDLAEMEDDGSFYKVERKTETPESKRRSMKVSRSEVKVFSKVLPLGQNQSQQETHKSLNSTLQEGESETTTPTDGRSKDLRKTPEESKAGIGRITDKINLFERRPLSGSPAQSSRAPRSADVSPARTIAGKFKADFAVVEQRSRSAERHSEVRSSYSSPSREKPLTFNERRMKFLGASKTEAESNQTQPVGKAEKASEKSITNLSASSRAFLELDGREKLDAKAGIRSKPEGWGTPANRAQISRSEVKPAETKEKGDPDQVRNREEGGSFDEQDGGDTVNNTSPNGSSRISSRSKKKKSREPVSPVDTQNTSTHPQDEREGLEEPQLVSKQTPEKGLSPTHESEKKSRAGSNVAADTLPDVQEGSVRAPALKDKPDTAVRSGQTKSAIDGDRAPSLPEERNSGEHALVSGAGGKYIDCKGASTSMTSFADEKLPDAKVLVQTGSVSKDELGEKLKSQSREPANLTETEGKPETKAKGKLNPVKDKCANATGELLSPQTGTAGGISPPSTRVTSNTQRRVGESPDQSTLYHPSEKTSGSSAHPLPTQSTSTLGTKQGENAAICTLTETNEAVRSGEVDKKPLDVGAATNVPPECPAQGAESAEARAAGSAAQPRAGNSLSESRTRGANTAECSSSEPLIKAAPADKAGSSNVANESSKPTSEDSSIKEYSTVPDGELTSDEVRKDNGGGNAPIKSGTLSEKAPGGTMELVFSEMAEKSRNIDIKSDIPPIKTAELFNGVASDSKVHRAEKPIKIGVPVRASEPSPFTNGDISSQSRLQGEKQQLNKDKWSQSLKSSASPNNSDLSSELAHQSPMKKLQLPLGFGLDDSSRARDTPSSWLDLDLPRHKLKNQEVKLTSSGSESNLLDTSGDLDDEDFVEKIKNLCVPFSLPPRKHNPIRSPQPPFAMPAIRETSLEKTFDKEEFAFGLRKRAQNTLETTPSLLTDLHSTETKSNLLPARASFAERSMLLSGLRDKNHSKDVEAIKEDKEEQVKVKSRLERSSIFSSLITSNFRTNRDGVQTLTPGNSDIVPPTETPQLASRLPSGPAKDPLSKQSLGDVHPSEEVVSDSGPPLPSFSDATLPDYLRKYLPRDPASAGVQSPHRQEQENTEFVGKMPSPIPTGRADLSPKPNLELADNTASRFPGFPPATQPPLPDLKQPVTQPQDTLTSHKTTTTDKGFHKRPGKMVLFEKAPFSGQAYEVYGDVADASSLQFSPLISVKVVRGCWMLYEKPDFQGRIIPLEEGGMDLENVWADVEPDIEPQDRPPLQIGSIRLAVRDYTIPHIDLFTEPDGHGRVTPFHDDSIETGSFGIPLTTASIQVHSGVWLLFSDPGFQGMLTVLEPGVYPVPEAWGFPSPFVGSLRPLKMAGLKVENPNEVKAVLFPKPGFEGSAVEIDGELLSFSGGDEAFVTDEENPCQLESVGSLKIIGGFWVGYSQPGFEGQQYVLEEGEYEDSSHWGGCKLQSLRPILSDFLSPHVKMFSDKQFGKLGVNIDLTVPVNNLDGPGYGTKTQSVNVISGVWVLFEEPDFCGECYILEKGLYESPEDWGAQQHRVGSAMPVVLDDFVNTSKFKVQLFSDPGYQGSVLCLEDSAESLQDSFSVGSCKVLAGSWLAFERHNFMGKMYVLEVGSYPDLRAMGCVSGSPSVLSLQTAGFEFSLPSITLFERSGLRGKRVLLTDGAVNLQLAGGCSRVQSVLVEGGMWILYEGLNYRGAQILLRPGEVPNWQKFSSWQKIGSLRPLIQKQVCFRLRNKQSGMLMSITGDLDDVKMMRIQEKEETGGFEQIWLYLDGHLHCKLLQECCLSPSGSVVIPGSRTGVTPEFDERLHLWSITPEGFIRYNQQAELVLDVKGGHQYDKNHVILNTLDPRKPQQRWDVEII